MAFVQIYLDDFTAECYTLIGRSHKMSRRKYITKFLTQAAKDYPGLYDKVCESLKKMDEMGFKPNNDGADIN